MTQNTPKKFHPTAFLAVLGAGGLSVAPFGIMQYAMPHSIQGLVTHQAVTTQSVGFAPGLIALLEVIMIVFAVIHFGLFAWFARLLRQWMKSEAYGATRGNPYASNALLTPLLALAMSFNVFIGTVRYFWPALHSNLQVIMPFALIAWIVLFVAVLGLAAKLLKHAFAHGVDLAHLPFSWMQYPMTIAMVSVTGTGFAAMSKTPWVAHTAFFLALIGLATAAVLFIFNLVTLFQHHFAKTGYPEKQLIPSMLAMVPIVSLFGISAYRITHYLHRSLHLEVEWLATLGVTGLFALQIMMLAFGLYLIKDFLRKEFTRDEYYPSLWALVCPFVGFAMMAAFTNTAFIASPIFAGLALASLATAIVVYAILMRRMLACRGLLLGRSAPQCA